MFFKKEKTNGITLIALVITIIVLLILAAVSIATLTGENGILSKAEIAKRQTEIEEAKEQAKLDITTWVAEKMEKGENADLDDSIVKGILTDKSYVKEQPGDNSFYTQKSGYEILYSELYTSKVKFTLTNSKWSPIKMYGPYEVTSGTTWEEFMKKEFANDYDWVYGPWSPSGKWDDPELLQNCVLTLIYVSSTAASDGFAPIVDSKGTKIQKDMKIVSRRL